jgi:hypothetical protein
MVALAQSMVERDQLAARIAGVEQRVRVHEPQLVVVWIADEPVEQLVRW